jgi:hypothetical protein
MRNTSKDRMNQCFMAAGGSVILFLCGMTILDCFSGGCALMFLGIFLFITSLTVAGVVFYPMARVFKGVMDDPGILARWSYDPAWYHQIVEREYEEHKERNRALLIVIDGMILGIAMIFFLFVPEGGMETGLIMLGVAALLFAVAKITPGLYRDRKEKMSPEALISRKGLIYEGSVYPYSGFMYGCTGVYYRGEKNPVLVFSFYQITGARIYDPFEIAVPVPGGQEERAREIAEILSSDIGTGRPG